MTGSSGSDDQLARHCAAGDQEAFAEIYRRHHQGLYRYCLSILRNPEDARDALQAAMEKAFRAMPTQRVTGGVRPWLFRIAHNESVSLASRRARHTEDPALAAAAAGGERAEQERLEQLIADLSTLPLQQRSALMLRELSGLATEEIGSALDISPSAAKQSIYEARVALRQVGEGRDMNCQRVQRKISDGDGRELRGRRVEAHLGDCAVCRSFKEAIGGRRAHLNMLFPPVGAAAAAKTLAAVTGAGPSGPSDASGATAGTAQTATPGRWPRYRRRTAAAGVIAILGAGAATGLLQRDDPAGDSSPPAQAKSDPPAAKAGARGRSRVAPPDRRRDARSRSSASPTSSGSAGYNSVGPAALQVLGNQAAANDQTGSGSGSGPGGQAGASQAGDGGGLPFTGLDLGLLLLAGAGLLSVGLLTRLWARPPA